jgi:hypothetical protein
LVSVDLMSMDLRRVCVCVESVLVSVESVVCGVGVRVVSGVRDVNCVSCVTGAAVSAVFTVSGVHDIMTTF